MAKKHCQQVGRKDLLLLDRGYPAIWLFLFILSKKAQFCARVSVSQWNSVKGFLKSGKKEDIVELEINRLTKKKCSELKLSFSTLKVRLLRIDIGKEEPEVLITSLIDTKSYPYELFKELYFKRCQLRSIINV